MVITARRHLDSFCITRRDDVDPRMQGVIFRLKQYTDETTHDGWSQQFFDVLKSGGKERLPPKSLECFIALLEGHHQDHLPELWLMFCKTPLERFRYAGTSWQELFNRGDSLIAGLIGNICAVNNELPKAKIAGEIGDGLVYSLQVALRHEQLSIID